MNTTRPPFEIRIQVLGAVEAEPSAVLYERFRQVAKKTFKDHLGNQYRFTCRTIETWYYRYKKYGSEVLNKKIRSDKHKTRKVSVSELAEAISDVQDTVNPNKSGRLLKSVLYQMLLKKGYFDRSQLSESTFYRLIREYELLNHKVAERLRYSFAMQHANELWQADTLHGPALKQPNGSYKKTFFIAFIDDASRVITHGEFFYRDNTENMVYAFRQALFKRGKPDRLYFDNGSNYKSKDIFQACLRLNIQLCHAPVRDGAAKGKIERFFRGFRDRFLTMHKEFEHLQQLNALAQQWIENEYNSQYHRGIRMVPIDRFNIDASRVNYLIDNEFSDELFYFEESRKVSKTNVFSIHSCRFECPVNLSGRTVEVRYDRQKRERYVVYFRQKRVGIAQPLDLQYNAKRVRKTFKNTPKPKETSHD